MTKILKKSLAYLLVFALCFTAIASCLAVSAEAPAMSCSFAAYTARLKADGTMNNDVNIGAVCEGERIRAQINLNGLVADSTVGISLLMPEGITLDDITFSGWNVNTSASFTYVSKHLDEETNWLTMVLDVTGSGNYWMFLYFYINENVPKDKVHLWQWNIEAATSSEAGDDNIYTFDHTGVDASSRAIEVKDHAVVVDAAVDATCEGTGLTEGSHCSRCEKTLVAQEEVAALGHDYDEGVVDPDATCTDEGVITYTCKNDPSHTYTEAISAKGHTEVAYEEVAATCTTVGYTGGTYCSVCDAVITPRTEVPALGHDYGEPVDNGNGTHTATCANDANHTITEDHEYVDGTCACGATEVTGPVLDEELEFRDIEVTVTSTVNVKYRVYKNDKNDKRGYQSLGYDHVEIVVTGDQYSFDNANLYNIERIPETNATKTASNSTGDTFLYEGIAMFSLGLNVEAYIKAYDAEGNYVAYSPVTITTPESALRVTLANSTTDGGRASIIELLNMAAAAQQMFAANKADSDLARDVAAGKLVNKDLPASVVTDVPTLNTATGVVWAEGKESLATNHEISASVSLTVSPNIRLTVKGKDKFEDSSKVTVDFIYTSPEQGNLDNVVTKSLTAADGGALTKRFNFDIPGFEFHNSNQTVTAKVYYDGELIATAQYSIETFVSEQLASASATQTAKDMATAIAKFGLAFRINKGLATA